MYIKTILRLLIRIIRQKTYKTLRTIRSKERLQVTIGIGLATLILIMITNFKYLSPKVYPLIRNQ